MGTTHECDWLKGLRESDTFGLNIHKNEDSWVLLYRSFASRYDVENGEADEAGESLGEVEVAIKYCPFCGGLLNDSEI